ncbi:MaoC family dehydratase N-terminal domain-containing protein [Pseudorhodoferax sp.]|uniref:MaoC family dehydratase N-terminal domain-containing protein n=1 Tax=Pseudorhodoferax sp. TaxID=1993553 RepID=UPI002DD61B7B|nr:MaoC family dehydratase N-terminal domain-containing protein [Pseudorhodoferax sp.]
MIDRRWIGHALPATEFRIERGRLRFFAQAIGETDPVYTDLDAARAAGHADLPAPPTFLFSAELDSGVTFAMVELLGVDLAKILHGEQSFRYGQAVVAGDTVTVRSHIADIYARKGGALQFIVKLSEAVNQRGEPVAQLRSVIVARS